MKIELECKLHLQEPAKTEQLLQSTGCEYCGRVYEKNWTFDKGGELERELSLLRLRVHDDSKWGILTHKCPVAENKFKRRQETETKVDNANNLRLILENLGYSKTWYYEKQRSTYKTKDAEIVLDTTPELGVFIEIEAKTENIIESILQRLNLNIADNLITSYREIWRQYCADQQRNFCDWKF